MKLYPLPGGDWAGTEIDWKAAMKAKGLDPKEFEATKIREVPTGKKELMEFLTFFGVDVYRLPGGAAPAAKPDIVVDHAALQARHNPDAPDLAPTPEPKAIVTNTMGQVLNLAELFEAAPIRVQAELVVSFADRAVARAG